MIDGLYKHLDIPAKADKSGSCPMATSSDLLYANTTATHAKHTVMIAIARCKYNPTNVLSLAPVQACPHSFSRVVVLPTVRQYPPKFRIIFPSVAAASSSFPYRLYASYDYYHSFHHHQRVSIKKENTYNMPNHSNVG